MDDRRIPGAAVNSDAALAEIVYTPSSPPSAEQVYHDYAPRVYRTARRMVSSAIDAEDVTQDVLLKVLRKLPSFRGEAAFPTWLHRITVNTALSHRRKRAVRQEHRADDPLDVVLANESEGLPGPEDQLVRQETRRLIEAAIAGLPARYRSVLVHADLEGAANADVAEALGLSLPAMKSRLHRARQMLRDALAAHFEPER
jgi:RNA polymerase sigma-70 factor (ECF subfamily)